MHDAAPPAPLAGAIVRRLGCGARADDFVRIPGTSEIPETRVVCEAVSRHDAAQFTFSEKAADALVGQGFRECCHYSLRDGKEIEAWGDQATVEALTLANPLTAEHTHLRASLLPGLLETLAHNQRNHNDLRRVFESGRVLRPGPKGTTELQSVAFAILTKPIAREWDDELAPDFHEAKLLANRLLAATDLHPLNIAQTQILRASRQVIVSR